MIRPEQLLIGERRRRSRRGHGRELRVLRPRRRGPGPAREPDELPELVVRVTGGSPLRHGVQGRPERPGGSVVAWPIEEDHGRRRRAVHGAGHAHARHSRPGPSREFPKHASVTTAVSSAVSTMAAGVVRSMGGGDGRGVQRPRSVGFTGRRYAAWCGITYRQLDYWARTGLLQPSVATAKGSGSRRVYSYSDVLELKVIKQLLDAGVSLQSARRAVECLRDELGVRPGLGQPGPHRDELGAWRARTARWSTCSPAGRACSTSCRWPGWSRSSTPTSFASTPRRAPRRRRKVGRHHVCGGPGPPGSERTRTIARVAAHAAIRRVRPPGQSASRIPPSASSPRLLDLNGERWEYEPVEFPLEWDAAGHAGLGLPPRFLPARARRVH